MSPFDKLSVTSEATYKSGVTDTNAVQCEFPFLGEGRNGLLRMILLAMRSDGDIRNTKDKRLTNLVIEQLLNFLSLVPTDLVYEVQLHFI